MTTKVANENQQYNKRFNRLVVDLTGASAVGCTFIISQENKLASTAMVEASTKIANDLTNEISTKLASQVEQALKQTNSGINFGQANTAVTRARISKYHGNAIR